MSSTTRLEEVEVTSPINPAAGSPLTPSEAALAASQSPSNNLAVFCREVRNLLRSKPNCMIPFSKFVPAYHNHYGRQCCVYQFGYTKLIELLEAIPHVVQILTDNSNPVNRYITLTHREQIKRFASDLIKVVKAQPGKKLRLSQFARAYEQVLGRTFRVADYGTNNINVLLAEIWEGTINIIPISRESLDAGFATASSSHNSSTSSSSGRSSCSSSSSSSSSSSNNSISSISLARANEDQDQKEQIRSQASTKTHKSASIKTRKPLFVDVPLPRNNPILEQLVVANELVNKPYITEQHPDCWFEIPRRERSEREIKRTKYFVWDCIELLSKMRQNQFAVPFSKFIPAYHYYFNRQCKVSIFGFSKLIDLFESISPHVVEIIDQGPGEDKLIRLARKYWPRQQTTTTTSAAHGGNVAKISNSRSTRCQFSRANGDYVIMSSSSFSSRKSNHNHQQQQQLSVLQKPQKQWPERDELQSQQDCCHNSSSEKEVVALDNLSDISSFVDDATPVGLAEAASDGSSSETSSSSEAEEEQSSGAKRPSSRSGPIDSGPTEEELLELEDELKAYEELQAIQRKRSGRMAAILDIFKYSIY